MKKESVRTVPAGKRPKLKRPTRYKKVYQSIVLWFRAKRIRGSYFAVLASFSVIMLLSLHNHFSSFVYVVILNNKEVGVVEEAKDVEMFISELTDRCGELYGIEVEPTAEVLIVKEFRPGSKPAIDSIEPVIRQQMTFSANAYMLHVNGIPIAALYNENDLDSVKEFLKAAYNRSGSGVTVLNTTIADDLRLEPCTVSPEQIYTPEEVVSLLISSNGNLASDAYATFNRVDLSRPLAYSFEEQPAHAMFTVMSPTESLIKEDLLRPSNGAVHVQTLEELVVTEPIPFEIEIVEDETLWIVQKEILTEGVEGLKELTYHITRENGAEVSRVKVGETVLSGPLTQVEAWGTAQVPSVGTGQFIWPVEDGGEVTPGRGFSTWHTGVDIHGTTGTNILAADSGVVWFSGHGRTQGNYIIIYHGSFWTLYLHNQINLVKEGDLVEQGDVIAELGSTGRSTGPHLHFEVRMDDGTGEWLAYYQHKPIDPLQFFKP